MDARVVAAAREVIDAETGVSTGTGTRGRVIRRVVAAVEDSSPRCAADIPP